MKGHSTSRLTLQSLGQRAEFAERLLEAQTALARLPAILQYGLVTGFVLLALYGRYIVGPSLEGPRFIFLLPAVLISVTLFGRAKWIYATLLSIAGMEFIFTEPALGFGFDTLAEVMALLSFIVICLLVATLVESLKTTASRLVVLNASLQKAVEDLARAEDQKSLLLYELNHRIKNDLSSVASTLNLQARSQTDHKLRDALLSASGRVNVLGRLYQPGDEVVMGSSLLGCDDGDEDGNFAADGDQ